MTLHEAPDVHDIVPLEVDGDAAEGIDPEVHEDGGGEDVHQQELAHGAALAEAGQEQADGRRVTEEESHVDHQPGVGPGVLHELGAHERTVMEEGAQRVAENFRAHGQDERGRAHKKDEEHQEDEQACGLLRKEGHALAQAADGRDDEQAGTGGADERVHHEGTRQASQMGEHAGDHHDQRAHAADDCEAQGEQADGMHHTAAELKIPGRHDNRKTVDDGQRTVVVEAHERECRPADGVKAVLGHAPVHDALRDGKNTCLVGAGFNAEVLGGWLHQVVDGFTYSPEQDADTDTGAQGNGEPAPQVEVGLGLAAADPDGANGRSDDAECENNDADGKEDGEPAGIVEQEGFDDLHHCGEIRREDNSEKYEKENDTVSYGKSNFIYTIWRVTHKYLLKNATRTAFLGRVVICHITS